MSATPRLKHFGWGREGEGLTAEEEAFVLARAEARFGAALKASASAPRARRDQAATPRASRAPASLAVLHQRALRPRRAHVTANPIPSSCAALRATMRNAPDVVAYPRNEARSRRRARLGGRRRRDA